MSRLTQCPFALRKESALDRLEIITGVERRRRYSDEERAAVLAMCDVPTRKERVTARSQSDDQKLNLQYLRRVVWDKNCSALATGVSALNRHRLKIFPQLWSLAWPNPLGFVQSPRR